jgi:hypothetical protein
MSWATWFTGKKHYPVPDQLGRMLFYASPALLLAAISWWAAPLLPDFARCDCAAAAVFRYLAIIRVLEIRLKEK